MSSTQTIPEAPRTPTLSEVIELAIDAQLRDVHVAMPGRIETYDAAEQKADVKPMVGDLVPTRDGTEIKVSLPVIPNVPVVFPRGGDYFLTFPIKAGDFVLLVCNERSIDAWASGDGAEKNADNFRTHELTDAVAIPGFYPFSKSIGEASIDANMVLGKDGGSTVHVRDDGEIHLGKENPSEFVALADKVKAELDAIKADLDAIKSWQALISAAAQLPIALEPGLGSPSVFQAQLIVALSANTYPTPHTPASVESTKVKAE